AGDDPFTYKLTTGPDESNTATVTITVGNTAPEGVADAYGVSHDQTLHPTLGVLGNDADAEGDAVTAAPVSVPQHRAVTLSADGTFHYTPDPLFVGTDAFAYRADDGLAEGDATVVTIDVTNAVPLAAGESFQVAHDHTFDGPSLLANDSDTDGDALTATLVTGPSHGTLSLNPDGTFAYNPELHYLGDDAFTYRVNDGLADSDTVTVNLQVVNTAPRALEDVYHTVHDRTFHAQPSVLDDDFDAEDHFIAVGSMTYFTATGGPPSSGSNDLTAVLVSGPSHGALTLYPDGTFDY